MECMEPDTELLSSNTDIIFSHLLLLLINVPLALSLWGIVIVWLLLSTKHKIGYNTKETPRNTMLFSLHWTDLHGPLQTDMGTDFKMQQ